jgi:hypothetical protein
LGIGELGIAQRLAGTPKLASKEQAENEQWIPSVKTLL